MKAHYDVLIIGSGFGGAIPALRLAQAGRSVAILEQGRRWLPQAFPRTTGQVSQRAFWQSSSRGLVEYRAFKRIDVIQGVGVGGGSLHYFNVHMRTPKAVFEDRRWPVPVKRDVLEPYYDLVQEFLESKPLAPPHGRSQPLRTNAFLEACKAARLPAELVDIAVYTGPRRNNAHANVPQSPCEYCGNCLLGCHAQSKNSLDISYIAAAERLGAEVYPLHRVDCIEKVRGARGYRVVFQHLSEDATEPGRPGSVCADAVVVAAGTLGTNELLLRCRDVHRTLPNLSRALGRGFSGNGDFLGAGGLGMRRLIDPASGPCITAASQTKHGRDLVTIEDLGLPDPLLWMLEGAMPPRATRVRAVAGWAGRYLARTLGIELRESRVSEELGALLAGTRTPNFLPFLGMGTDAADGRLRLVKGRLDIEWSPKNSRRVFAAIEAQMRRIVEAGGGRYVTSVLWRWPTRKLLTAHPLGGCAPGDAPGRSVVNHCGEVWGYPGLYVTDGAAIPTALSVNPSLTISALAERASHWIIHQNELMTNRAPVREKSLALAL